jgi:hypothetical protein
MKKLFFIIIGVMFLSCSKGSVPKPDKLIDKDIMVDIIYDTSILQATDGVRAERLAQSNVKIADYIYRKYNIDSVSYYQNHKYYASDLRVYKKMYKEVLARIEKAKIEVDTLIQQKNKGKMLKEVPLPD